MEMVWVLVGWVFGVPAGVYLHVLAVRWDEARKKGGSRRKRSESAKAAALRRKGVVVVQANGADGAATAIGAMSFPDTVDSSMYGRKDLS